MIISRTTDIAAPAERVWSVMADVARWPEWTASVSKIEPLDQGPLRVGSRARVTQPKLPVAVWTVTALEPGRFFEWRNQSPGLLSIGRHGVEPDAKGGSRATLSIEWSGWMKTVIRLFYRKLTERYVELEAEGLKRRSEQV